LTLCQSLHAEALQAPVSEELSQGPYVVARAGFKPTTLQSKGIDSTNAPPRPTMGRVEYLMLSVYKSYHQTGTNMAAKETI